MFNPHEEEEEARDIQELMQRYQNLILGRANAYIEEDDFEKIIEHLDEKDEVAEAIEAANLALNQYPFSALDILTSHHLKFCHKQTLLAHLFFCL